MQKLLVTLATISLISGSIATTTTWVKQKQLIIKKQMLNQTWQKKHNVKDTTAGQAEDGKVIANKLNGKVIKLDPNYWLGKNTVESIDHASVGEFADAIVKQGLLTDYEQTYVTWNQQTTIVRAQWFWTVHFTVDFNGKVGLGTVAINATTGETTDQIVTKLKSRPVQLNYSYWNGKNLLDNLAKLKSIIVNEDILTKAEASLIVGIYDDPEERDFYTVGSDWIGQPNFINYNVNDNNTDSSTMNYRGIDVLNDGEDAQQLANKVDNLSNIKLGSIDYNLYADSSQALEDIRAAFVTGKYYNTNQVKYLDAPHKIITKLLKIVFTFKKDGQFVQTVPVTVHILNE